MYKRASRNLQHANRVDALLPTGGYIGHVETIPDLLPSAGNLSYDEVRSELDQLTRERLKLEAANAEAKARGDRRAVIHLGQQIQVLVQRVAPLKVRERDLNSQKANDELSKAIRVICDKDTQRAIWDMAAKIRKGEA